jgi:outer membrane protein assembly factor BamB
MCRNRDRARFTLKGSLVKTSPSCLCLPVVFAWWVTLSLPFVPRGVHGRPVPPTSQQVAEYLSGVPYGDARILLTGSMRAGQAPVARFVPKNQIEWWTKNRLLAFDDTQLYVANDRHITAYSRASMTASWSVEGPQDTSPTQVRAGGGRLLYSDAGGGVTCVGAGTGRTLWRYQPAHAPAGGNVRANPVALSADSGYISSEDNLVYTIVEVDAATGAVVRTAQPQQGDDLAFHLDSLDRTVDGSRWYAVQSGRGAGVHVPAVLALDSDLNRLWKRDVFSFVETGRMLVCVVGASNNNANWVPRPDQVLVGIDRNGHERWRRPANRALWLAGKWRGAAVLVVAPPTAARKKRRALRLSGINPANGQTTWKVDVRQ